MHSSARTAGVAVLTGDFNVPAPSVLYPRVTDDGAWSDPFAATDPPTFQQAFLPPDRRASRIDYVLLARGYTAAETGLLFAAPVGGVYASDHIGLTARIAVSGHRPDGRR